MLRFKSFWSVSNLLVGTEFIRTIQKGPFHFWGSDTMSLSDQLHELAGKICIA
jgi:hypothetical protein